MEEISDLLCSRMEALEGEIGSDFNRTFFDAKKEASGDSLAKGDYYSAASFCFGASILAREQLLKEKNLTEEQSAVKMDQLKMQAQLLKEEIRKEEMETISDLQTLMIVESRLDEVRERAERFNQSAAAYYNLAYTEERLYSAVAWMSFFEMEGKKFEFSELQLQESCLKKISEGKERYQYANVIFAGFDTRYIDEKLDYASENYQNGDYALCLIQAAQAKAEADALLSAMGLSEESLDSFIDSKMLAVQRIIAEAGEEDVFPILGYSYYQYANSLREDEKHSALLYLEYALEMSDLDLYFPEKKMRLADGASSISKSDLSIFLFGFFAGALFVYLLAVILGRKLIKKRR
jgi:predicted S18 family serine protease